jgi:hypothetical protein
MRELLGARKLLRRLHPLGVEQRIAKWRMSTTSSVHFGQR